MVLAWVLAGCGAQPTATPPTITPRPTLEPRTPPTAIPTAVAAGALTADETKTVALPGGAYVVLTYSASEAQQVRITARALSDDGAGNPLDVVVDVLDAEGVQLAYGDDRQTASDEELAPTDAEIPVLQLERGTYRVRVNAFNGFQAGRVGVSVAVLDGSQ
jgi:hypothetical protein